MMRELWIRRGVVLRGLGDHGHYAIPVWRDLLEVGVPLPPLVAGLGPLPHPERLYFRFGQAIDSTGFDDPARLRDEVRAEVLAGLDELFALRDADPQRSLARRLTGGVEPEPSDPQAHFVARAFEAWNEGGVEASAAWMSRWVHLTDPPGWPGAATWRGRDAVLRRLADVAGQLGAHQAEVTEARSSSDDGVLATFALQDAKGRPTEPGAFQVRVEIDGGQIVTIEVLAP